MTASTQESERLITIAREYEQKGYRVVVESSSSDLPEFLKGHRPDIVAFGKDDNVVVEVKSRSSLSGEVKIQELAHLVEAEQGWRFELVLVQDPSVRAAPNGSSPFKEPEIERSIEAANILETKHFDEAALVSAWSALEAAIRLQCERENVELERFTPDYVLKQAVTYGIVSRREYLDLLDALKYRNAFVHGFTMEGLDPRMVRELNEFATRLLSQPTQD